MLFIHIDSLIPRNMINTNAIISKVANGLIEMILSKTSILKIKVGISNPHAWRLILSVCMNPTALRAEDSPYSKDSKTKALYKSMKKELISYIQPMSSP